MRKTLGRANIENKPPVKQGGKRSDVIRHLALRGELYARLVSVLRCQCCFALDFPDDQIFHGTLTADTQTYDYGNGVFWHRPPV